MTGTEYEQRLQLYVGESLSNVFYYDGRDEENDTPYYTEFDKPFHCLMWGIELRFTSGKVLGLQWGSDFDQYGLDLIEKAGQESEYRWDVSNVTKWENVLNKKIKSIKIFWSRWSDMNDAPLGDFFPQDIIITFETGDMFYISAADYHIQDDNFHFGTSGVTIFFDEAITKQYKLLATQSSKK